MLRNDRKCDYIFNVFQNDSARQQCISTHTRLSIYNRHYLMEYIAWHGITKSIKRTVVINHVFHPVEKSDINDCRLGINRLCQWASYQIRKIAVCACAGNAGNVFPHRRFRRKPLVSDPGMHHGTCVTHVPWCMSGSLTCGGGGNVPGIPGACAPAILRIWQEAHDIYCFKFLAKQSL